MDILNDNNLLDLQVNDDTNTQLTGLTKWINIYTVLNFIGLGISIITTVVGISKISSSGLPTNNTSSTFGTTLFTVIISLALNILLYQAGKNLKLGLDTKDQGFFSIGIAKLSAYFKLFGILMIIFLAFMALVLFAVIAIATMGGFNR